MPHTIRTDDDLYARLGVASAASTAEITAAFRAHAKERHPDRNPGDTATAEQFKLLTQAYDVLTRPELRAEYDRRRPADAPPAPAAARSTAPTTGRARAAKWGGVALLLLGIASGVLLASVDTGDGAKTITLWIVVVKLIVCGSILAAVGAWRLQRLRTGPASPVTAR